MLCWENTEMQKGKHQVSNMISSTLYIQPTQSDLIRFFGRVYNTGMPKGSDLENEIKRALENKYAE